MDKHIILASHGKLAEGMKDSLLYFNDSLSIDIIVQEINETSIENDLEILLEKHTKDICIVFTDLYGGSVNQMSLRMLKKYDFFLISGMNLGLILEISYRDIINDEVIVDAINASNEQVTLMNTLL